MRPRSFHPPSPSVPSAPSPLVIWRLLDGKPGHEKQTLGLANALTRLTPCQRHDLAVPGRLGGLTAWLMRRFPLGTHLPDPDLIVVAGHATHLPALAARQARGGRCVVLMKPSLPLAWFDLCLIPQHDNPPKRENVIVTRGVLNAVVPSPSHRAGQGLFLIGGASGHYDWDDRAVVAKVLEIAHATPTTDWRLTTSRRTPADFLPTLHSAAPPANLVVVPQECTPPGWVEQALADAGEIWVTEDSVSMIYEALTSGGRVGVLPLAARRGSRVHQGVEALIAAGMVATLGRAIPEQGDSLRLAPFNEAERCARLILEKWPKQVD